MIDIRTQAYAKRAYPLIEGKIGSAEEAKYRTLALRFPAMILQSGLAQAIGFLMAKGEPEHDLMLEDIAQILQYPNGRTLHEAILKSQLQEYQLLTRRTLEATAWLKRYTQALLEKE